MKYVCPICKGDVRFDAPTATHYCEYCLCHRERDELVPDPNHVDEMPAHLVDEPEPPALKGLTYKQRAALAGPLLAVSVFFSRLIKLNLSDMATGDAFKNMNTLRSSRREVIASARALALVTKELRGLNVNLDDCSAERDEIADLEAKRKAEYVAKDGESDVTH